MTTAVGSKTLPGSGLGGLMESNAAKAIMTVAAVIILDSTSGERLLAKYYPLSEQSSSVKRQQSFEALIYERTKRALEGEVTMCEGCVVVYKANMDIVVYVVGQRWENNELMLMMPLEAIFDSLSENIKPQLDKRSLLENYEDLAIIVDETVDRGIVLETSVPDIVSKTSKAPVKPGNETSPTSEQTLSSAFSFARDRFKSLLKQ